MKIHHKRLRIRLDDEAHLQSIADFSLSRGAVATIIAASVAVFLFLAAVIIMVTPVRTLLPGYMKQQQRSATEDNLLRLDSLRAEYEINQRYIDNFLRVADTDRIPADTAEMSAAPLSLTPDSLLIPSPRENKFVGMMEERERFNISVLAPLAADGMLFAPVSDTGIFTADSKNSEVGKVIVPAGGTVQSAADGSVLASYYSPSEQGYVIVLQHSRGFASRYSGLASPMVVSGDLVNAGQIIALPPAPDAAGRRILNVMMWHNGLPVIPYKYIGNFSSESEQDSFEAPRGR